MNGAPPRIATIMLRRSAGLSTASVAIAVIAAQLALRAKGWTHEWTWATYQMGFLTVLLAPVIAATGAWEGHRQAAGRSELATYPRAWRTTAVGWLGVTLWASAIYVGTVLTAWSWVALSGTSGTPTPRDLVTTLPPLAFLAAAAAAGYALGHHLGRLISIPLAAVGWFAATLYFYTAGPASFVTVGGATGSLVASRPRVDVQLQQLVFLAAVALACLTLIAHRPGATVWLRWRAYATTVPALIVLVGAGSLLSHQRTFFERTAQATRCVDQHPQICVALGYQRHMRAAHDVLARYVDALSAAGVTDVPTRFDQTSPPGQITTAPLSPRVLDGHHAEARGLVVLAYLSKPCAAIEDERLRASFDILDWYLAKTVDGDETVPRSLPNDVVHGDAAAQQSAVRDAAAYLSACSRGLPSK